MGLYFDLFQYLVTGLVFYEGHGGVGERPLLGKVNQEYRPQTEEFNCVSSHVCFNTF